MNILITGDAGFIGGALKARLQQTDNVIFGADLKNGFDLRDYNTCKKVTQNIDYVYHLACEMGGLGYLKRWSSSSFYNGQMINLNMLKAVTENGGKRFFFSSSACVYPEHIQTISPDYKLKETDAFNGAPDLSYGMEKLLMEQEMRAYKEDYGLQIRIARFHNIYGPGSEHEDSKDKAPAALCKKAIRAKDGDSIVVWGDGRQTRSFLFVKDCVDGIIKLMDSNYSEPVNLGSEDAVTIDQLANLAIKESGKNLGITHDLTKPQGVRYRNADITIAKEKLNWQPTTSLEDGMMLTYRWLRNIYGDKQ
jgi:GDP-D-mannose 3', 5'-epimerase